MSWPWHIWWNHVVSSDFILHAGEMLDAWLFIVSSHLPQMRMYHVVVASL